MYIGERPHLCSISLSLSLSLSLYLQYRDRERERERERVPYQSKTTLRTDPLFAASACPSQLDGLEIYQNIASCKNKLVNLKVHYCERYHAIGICFILFHRGIIAMAKMIMSEISWFLRCPSSSQIIAEYRLHVPMNKSLKMQILGFDGCGHQCKKRKQQWR